MTETVDNVDRSVSCSFCNEKFLSSKEMGEHLMMCGNKTDECPNCHKFIRRAIFAYHYENNCANLDETESNGRSTPVQTKTISTYQPSRTSQSSSRVATGHTNSILTETIQLKRSTQIKSTPRQSSNSARSVFVCSYCKHEFNSMDQQEHEQNCLEKRRLLTHPIANGTTDWMQESNELYESYEIICEYCKGLMKLSTYDAHKKTCYERYHRREQEQSQRIHGIPDTTFVQCQYCNNEYMPLLLKSHERICIQNPKNI